MTTASVSHLTSVIAATRDAVSQDAANAHVVFAASAQAHDAVASTVSLGRYSIEVDEPPAEGDLDVRGFFGFDDAVRAGFGEVRVVVPLTGPESRERYLELQEAVDAHCPVLDLTRNPTPVSTVVETLTGDN
ncbi:OsmC family protein [Rhodococcus opacus]|uniref:OsmC-like protein n=1 Tax=Rhodococcus opacus (strain B4) TaxID=632772 RepID=C1ATW5_RHOOB|nr:OsmC family protein [Rhodococcus opacus]BAH53379.1 hypothetical protein ROP_51320 [Rhodococcus opacus B4]